MKRLAALILVTLLVSLVRAQTSDVITAENISRLQSVAHINFADLPLAEAGRLDSGWFAVSPDGERYAMVNRAGSIVLWDLQAGLVKVSVAVCSPAGEMGGFIDGAFDPTGSLFVSTHLAGQSSYVAYHTFDANAPTTLCNIPATPLHIWLDESRTAWLEVLPNDPQLKPSVIRLPFGESAASEHSTLSLGEQLSGPENDSDSFLRIGRVQPPLSVTATQRQLVKRWNLETGAVTAQAQVGRLPGMGAVNASGSHFAWADSNGVVLNLLDFETGSNRELVPLQGMSIPFLLLTLAADVIIGVNVDYEPLVVAWDANRGKSYQLGAYRSCNRQPDMVRLSRDGTTLVIGCDTGLDVWRINKGT